MLVVFRHKVTPLGAAQFSIVVFFVHSSPYYNIPFRDKQMIIKGNKMVLTNRGLKRIIVSITGITFWSHTWRHPYENNKYITQIN